MSDVEVITRFFVVFGLSMTRLTIFFNTIPFLGSNIMTNTTRTGVITSLALIVYPTIAPSAPADLPFSTVLGLFVKEAILGFFLSYVVSVGFWVMEGVGFIVDNQRGVSQATVFDPLYGYSTSPLGSLLLQGAVALFFAIGGFLVLLSAMFKTYEFWPVFEFYPAFKLAFSMYFVSLSAELLKMIFLIAAPFLVVFFIVNIGLGLISRLTPQLNVFFIAMPINSGLTFLILALYMAIMYSFYKEKYLRFDALFEFLKAGL